MEIDRALELYREFLTRVRDGEGLDLELAPYPQLGGGQDIHFMAMLFHEVGRDLLRQLANITNEFYRYLVQLDAWRPIYMGVSKEEKHDLLLDHIRPLTVLCLNAPYSIRGRIVHATCTVSQHARHFIDWPDGKPDWTGGHADMTTAKRLTAPWKSWPGLAAAIGAMAHEDFTAATSNFRNEHHHGHPRSIELGYVSAIRRLPGDRESWSMGERGPLSIEDLIPPLVQEHKYSVAAFRAFRALVEEQMASAPLPENANAGEVTAKASQQT